MIIDVSNTIGKHRFKPEISAESLISQMDEAGVDIAVIHSYAESLDNITVENATKKYPKRFVGLFTVNPWSNDSPEELEKALSSHHFVGLYMDPLRHGYMLCESQVFYPLLDVCKNYKAPVWCYGAAEVFSAPVFFAKIAEDFPDVCLIMGRMGLQYDNASAVQIAKKYSNVYLETSASMDFNTFRAIKEAGVDKVLLGTGTPEAGYFQLEINKVKNALKNIHGGEDKVLYENAARIFHILKEEK